MHKNLKFELEQILNFIDENSEKIEEEKVQRFNQLLEELKSSENEESVQKEVFNFINELEDEFGYKKRFVKLYQNVIDFDDIINTVDRLKEFCKIKVKSREEI